MNITTLPIPETPHAGNQRHFAFIFRGSKLLVVGVNSKKTHPLAKYYKQYRFTEVQCAELNALIRLGALHKDRDINFKKLHMVVIRISKEGKFLYSKPCKGCCAMLARFKFKAVQYSDSGELVTL